MSIKYRLIIFSSIIIAAACGVLSLVLSNNFSGILREMYGKTGAIVAAKVMEKMDEDSVVALYGITDLGDQTKAIDTDSKVLAELNSLFQMNNVRRIFPVFKEGDKLIG